MSTNSLSSGTEQRLFACERCSRRKQRCDRTIPVCQPCREAQAECVASAREETVISGNNKTITRKGPVTRLLERIEALEEQLRNNEPRDPDDSSTAADHDMHRPPPAGHEAGTALPSPTNMNMRFLSLSAMAEPCSRQGEFLKHLSTPRLIAGMTKTYGGDPESSSPPDSLWEGISTYLRHPQGNTHRLRIPAADANKALEIYLEAVDFRFPLLPVAKVSVGIDAISHPEEDYFRRIVASDPAPIFMAYAVITIVPLVSDAYPISQGSWVAMHLLGKCMKLLDRVFHQEDGIDVIQCLRLLVILAVHCSAAGSAWHLSSFAMNKCIALGYHREDPKSNVSIFLPNVQQRRWAFWGCYLLDVLICAALGRPTSIDAKHITTPLPDAASSTLSRCAEHGQVTTNLRSATTTTQRLDSRGAYYIHLFRYAKLLSQVVSDAPVNPLCATVSEDFEHFLGQVLGWRIGALPHDEPNECNIYLFQTSLYNTLMLRLAVRELLTLFSFEMEFHDSGRPPQLSAIHLGIMNLEQSRITKLKLPQICSAVAGSIDRIHMTGRSYLSLVTGYSSLAMAFTCLYCMAARIVSDHLPDDSVTQSIPQRPLDPAGRDTSQHPLPPFRYSQDPGYPESSTVSDISRCYQPSSEGRTWADSSILEVDRLNDAFNIAIAKLDVVGRQFPRLNHYGRMALNIHKLLTSISSQAMSVPSFESSVAEQLKTIQTCAMDVGPMYLRQLTAAILCVITRRQSG